MEYLKVENRRMDAAIAGGATITPERIVIKCPVVVLDVLDVDPTAPSPHSDGFL